MGLYILALGTGPLPPQQTYSDLNAQDVSGSVMLGSVKEVCASVRRPQRSILACGHPYTISTIFSLCHGVNTSVLHFTLQPQHCPQSLYKVSLASEEAPLQKECPGVDVSGQLVNNCRLSKIASVWLSYTRNRPFDGVPFQFKEKTSPIPQTNMARTPVEYSGGKSGSGI